MTNSILGHEKEYLARCSRWNWHDDATIDTLDADNRITAHLSQWQTFVFHEADGNTSTEEIIFKISERYKENAEQNFGKDILESATELVYKLKVVELWPHKGDLAENFNLPSIGPGNASA